MDECLEKLCLEKKIIRNGRKRRVVCEFVKDKQIVEIFNRDKTKISNWVDYGVGHFGMALEDRGDKYIYTADYYID